MILLFYFLHFKLKSMKFHRISGGRRRKVKSNWSCGPAGPGGVGLTGAAGGALTARQAGR